MRNIRRRKKRKRILIAAAAAAILLLAAAFALFGAHLFPIRRASVPSPTLAPSAPPKAPPSLPVSSTPNAEQQPAQVQPIEARSLYEAALTVFANARLPYVQGALRLTYVNTSADVLYEVKLRLYPNDIKPGCMVLHEVAVDEEAAYYTLSGQNKSVLNIPLSREIAPGESARIFITFNIGLPETGGRFGVNKTGLMLGNMLPIAAVYEQSAWRTDAYVGVGDAFYSECADYKLTLSAPDGWELAHTGSLVDKTSVGGVSTWYIAAPESRDFAMALVKAPCVEKRVLQNGFTTVTAFGHNKNHAAYEADVAAAALDYFNENIGEYPYDTFFVVPFDAGGGMEYPGLVMICENDLRTRDLTGAALVIGHEAAHQWFYAVVGSDQINAPWLDEALCEYLGFAFLRSYAGEEKAGEMRMERFGSLAEYERKLRIDAPLYDFDPSDYFYVVYASGYQLYEALETKLGRAAFYEALRAYFSASGFRIATARELYQAFTQAAGEDIVPWFEQALKAPRRR